MWRMHQPSTETQHSETPRGESGIKVLDRAVSILFAIAEKPRNLNGLTEATGLPRATAHRLASALEAHRLLTRSSDGTWVTGPALQSLATGNPTSLIEAATPIMKDLVALTGESVQLYQREGNARTCIAAHEPPSGLQNTVPVGSRLPLTSGSAAYVFAAYSSEATSLSEEDLETVRQRGWAESIEEREPGLASVSAPVHAPDGTCLAVLSISGPTERLNPSPGKKWATDLVHAAARLEASIAQ